MAWNVVIAGGGFGGAYAARELERLLPKQSARLMLVNDVNFLLYTPFLPEAAAGTLEPRHVVTPLREILKRTFLRLGAVDRPRPGGAHGRDPDPRGRDPGAALRRADPRPRVGVAVAAGPRVGERDRVQEPRGRDLASKPRRSRRWRPRTRPRTPRSAEELLTYVFVGGGYAGLEALAELQDFAVDAMDSYPLARLQGMRWILVEATDRVLPEIDRGLAEYAARELRGRGIDIRLGTRLESVDARLGDAHHRRADPHPDASSGRRA